ncbi:hypothetical protein [Microbacterium aurum]
MDGTVRVWVAGERVFEQVDRIGRYAPARTTPKASHSAVVVEAIEQGEVDLLGQLGAGDSAGIAARAACDCARSRSPASSKYPAPGIVCHDGGVLDAVAGIGEAFMRPARTAISSRCRRPA